MSKIVRSIKNVANGYSSAQVLVRNATSNDASGPTTYDMEEIAGATYNGQTEFLEIMDMLDRRLNDKGKNWRHVAKSLTVLDYLVRFGSEKCVLWSKDNLYIIKTLREFVHFDDGGTDQGAIIRVKAKELVSLLRDDERLAREREAARQGSGRRRRRSDRVDVDPQDPYDDELQRALELSRETAEEERARSSRVNNDDANDDELQQALKLSLEEEEMRKQKLAQNENLLDISDNYQQQQQQQPQFYYQPAQFVQQPQFFQPQNTFLQQPQQYDMFGNPIQASTTGMYNQFGQPQQSQPQIPQFTGFADPNSAYFNNNNTNNNASNTPHEELKPLKTGSNNPFALLDSSNQNLSSNRPQTLNDLQLQNTAFQPSFYTQPDQSHRQQQQQQQPQQQQQQPQLIRQNTASRYNDSHELNNLLATGPGVDTFGNTGATRIPHQHTRTGTFVNSSGTGFKQTNNDVRLSSNATGNPFLNTGIGSTAQYPSTSHSRIDPAPTGYGFGNARDGEPSLIDI